MPVRDDTMLRSVEQLAEALARLSGAEERQAAPDQHAALRAEIDGVYRTFLGSSPGLVRRLSSDDLLAVLRSAGHVDAERAFVVAALLEVDAEAVALAAGPGDAELAQTLRARALDLVLEAGLAEVGEPDLPERVDRLERGTDAAGRSAATWARLHRFRNRIGAFARAEDALFGWLEAEPGPEVAAAGGAFYSGLFDQDDAALAAGDLPRDEVAEGRDAFVTALEGAGVAPPEPGGEP